MVIGRSSLDFAHHWPSSRVVMSGLQPFHKLKSLLVHPKGYTKNHQKCGMEELSVAG